MTNYNIGGPVDPFGPCPLNKTKEPESDDLTSAEAMWVLSFLPTSAPEYMNRDEWMECRNEIAAKLDRKAAKFEPEKELAGFGEQLDAIK